jgi:hypothetical protein
MNPTDRQNISNTADFDSALFTRELQKAILAAFKAGAKDLQEALVDIATDPNSPVSSEASAQLPGAQGGTRFGFADAEEYIKIKTLTAEIKTHLKSIEDIEFQIQMLKELGMKFSLSRYELEKTDLDLLVASLKLSKLETDDQAELLRIDQEILATKKEILANAALVQNYNNTKNLLTALTGVKEQYQGIMGLLQNMALHQGTMRGMVDGAKDLFTGLNVGLAVLSKVAEETRKMVFAYDEAFTSFNKNTGAAAEYKNQIEGAYKATNKFGVEIGLASSAAGALFTGMNQFSELSQTMQKELIMTTAKLTKLGIAESDSTSILKGLTMSYGMTAGAANKFYKGLIEDGMKMGLAPKAIAQGLKEASNAMSAYGQAGVEHSMKLLQLHKETGVAVSKLVDLNTRMLSIENAANMAAGLAVMAGKQVIDAVSYIGLDPAQKADKLREVLKGISAQGKMTAQDMNYMAEQTGMSLEDVNAMINGTATSADKQIARQANIDKAIAESITFMEKMRNAFDTLAIAVRPILDILRYFAEGLSYIMNAGDGMGGKLLVIGGAALVMGRMAVSAYLAWRAASAATVAAVAANNTAMIASTRAAAFAMKAAIVSTGIGALVVAGGWAVGKIMGSSSSEDDGEEVGEQFSSGMEKSIPRVREAGINMTNAGAESTRSNSPPIRGGFSTIDKDGESIGKIFATSIEREMSSTANTFDKATTNVKESLTNNMVNERMQQSISNIKESVAATKEVTKSVTDNRSAVNSMNNTSSSTLVKEVSNNSDERKIVLQLNERELATVIIDIMKKNFNLSMG